MKAAQFYKLARQHFGQALESHGFTAERSRRSTFFRKRGDLYDVVTPSLHSRNVQYDVRVFVTSPLIEPNFDDLFPDEIGIPSGGYSCLNRYDGVGPSQELYWCRTEAGFIRNFNERVAPLIEPKALPFLDQFRNLEDLLPYLEGRYHLALALWESGAKEKAIPLLRRERTRLAEIRNDPDDLIDPILRRIDDVLQAVDQHSVD